MATTLGALAAFELAKVIEERRATGDAWMEFFRVPALSLGLYVLPAGGEDPQSPHGQDEVYFVVSGRAAITVGEETTQVARGSVVYVPAGVPHRFHHISEDLRVLVVFSPPEA